jgi:malonyl-CoA/methylmalonyl-CoA synthetase
MPNHLISLLLPAGADRERRCLVLPDGRSLTYAELDRETARYAAALAAAGVKPGDRVAAQVEKSPEALFLYLGALRAGAVFLPLNTAYTPAEVTYFLADAEPALFVARPEEAGTLAPLATKHHARFETLGADGGGTLATLVQSEPRGSADVPRRPDDLAAILYTSGTTGRSKGAMLTHGNLRSNAEALVETWRFTRDDVLIHALPIFHVHGLFVATNVALAARAQMIFLPRFEPREVLARMREATVLMGVPTFYTRLLAVPELDAAATAHMRLFVSGSAPLLADTHAAFRARTGHAILERYGMTETGMNTSNPYDGERVPGSVGLPLPRVEIRVVEPEGGTPLPAGEIGMIEVRGPNVFPGYWRMPEKTREDFRSDGFFVTGDLGRLDARGYLWIVGRGKDVVITGGYNVYPKEVELEIDALPGVAESAVVGLPHPDYGEAVTALIVPGDGAELSAAEIIERLRGRLAGYKLPKRVLFVDELPRNTMAKVQKNKLRDAYADLYRNGPEDT